MGKQKKNQFIASRPAVIYARYSSRAQNDESIEQQVEKCQAYAAANNLRVTKIYEDRHMSGTNDRRPGFQRLMRDAGMGAFGFVIAWKSNRIGRNMLEAMQNDNKLRDMGVRCLYVEEDFDDTAAGRFALRSMMNVNQFHSENMAEDIYRGLMYNANLCKVNGKVPLGYKKGEDGKFAIDEGNAEIVREIFRRVNAGDLYADIIRDLNARHIKTAYGKEWNKNSFHSLLSNERYTGVYIYGEVRIPDGMPAIIDKELFAAVQKRTRQIRECVRRRRGNDEDYLLTGKLYCGNCGAHMVGMCGRSKNGGTYFYYSCQTRRTSHKCNKANVRKDAIERLVVEVVRDNFLTDANIEKMADIVMEFQKHAKDMSNLTLYQQQLTQTRHSIENILKAIEAGVYTKSTKQRLEDLEREEATIQCKLAEERSMLPTVTREQLIFSLEEYRNGSIDDPDYQRRVIDHFIRAVYLYDDKLMLTANYNADSTIDIPLTLSDLNPPTNQTEVCSLKFSYGPPKESQANTLRFIRGVFVFTYFFRKNQL